MGKNTLFYIDLLVAPGDIPLFISRLQGEGVVPVDYHTPTLVGTKMTAKEDDSSSERFNI